MSALEHDNAAKLMFEPYGSTRALGFTMQLLDESLKPFIQPVYIGSALLEKSALSPAFIIIYRRRLSMVSSTSQSAASDQITEACSLSY
jgi:hypothetical protein